MINLRPDYLKAAISDYRRISKSKVQSWRKWLTLKKNLKSLVTLLSAGFAVSLMVIVYLALQPPKVIILDEAPFKPISVDLSPIEPQHSELPVAEVKAVKPAPAPPQTNYASGNTVWDSLAQCESGGNPRAVDPSGTYFGLYQFDLPTWQSNGGNGNPIDNSPAEQLRVAKVLHSHRGFQPWPSCARQLGLL